MFASLARTEFEDAPAIGRRAAPRLRVSIPARIVSLYDTQRCVLLNLSRTGARIALEKPLKPGDGAFLQCASIDHFASIVRAEDGANALAFDVPLFDDEVLQIRRFAEGFEERERRELRDSVRSWVSGKN